MISDDYIANLPDSPGVYLFKDEAKEILYVGKARSIKDRVKSYFGKGAKDTKTERLLRRVQDVRRGRELGDHAVGFGGAVHGLDNSSPAGNADSPERWHLAGLDRPERVSRQDAGAPASRA